MRFVTKIRRRFQSCPWNGKKNDFVRTLYRGDLRVPSQQKSLAFFTVHRCASSFVGQLLSDLALEKGIIPIDIEGFVHASPGVAPIDQQLIDFHRSCSGNTDSNKSIDESICKRFFRPHGLFFGPIRDPRCINQVLSEDGTKSILMLRDPRDVLTSLYFSILHSHAIPNNPNAKQTLLRLREEGSQVNIDQYISYLVAEWAGNYRMYCTVLVGRPDVMLLKYEDMVADFPSWFDRLTNFWQIELRPRIRDKYLQRANFDVKREDKNAHKRKVTPGDFRAKLRPQTIEMLNYEFRDVLDLLGYSTSEKAAA